MIGKWLHSKFYKQLDESKWKQEGAHTLWWQQDCRVSSTYKLSNQDNQQMINWPWKHIWKVKTPFKVAYFTWLIS